jgi:hypothetical protein
MNPTRQPTARAGAVYPLPRPAGGDDARFTPGLALDVADVLVRHGYPPLRTATDLLHLQLALFAAIYAPPDKETPHHDPPPPPRPAPPR